MSRFRKSRRPAPTTDQRTPDQRLEALVTERNRERALRMLRRIRDDLDTTAEPGPWLAAARTLSDRLIISHDSFIYFCGIFTECVIARAALEDDELVQIFDQMKAIEHAHGLDPDDSFFIDEAPAEWRMLNDRWNRRSDAIVAETLRQSGHADVAMMQETNSAEFERRSENGCEELWGPLDDLGGWH